MFRSLSSKGNGSSSSSKNKKTDASSSSRKRAESIVSSSSNRKASRAEERSSEPYTTPTSSSQYTYPAMNGSSGPSSYVTAPDSRMNDRYEYSAPARPASLTENAIRALSTEDGAWEDMDARSDQRSRVSGDHKKRHKKNRSRSDSRDRSARKDKRDRSDKPSESSRAKRRPEDSIVRERALDSPRESSRGYDTFSAQVGAASFSQFPGQYNEPLVGPPSSYQRPDMSSHVQDQFPGQDPIQYATSAFRPGKTVEEGGFGLAADFYNDQGQSVSGQPGIRPESATIITGTQPHLMTASALPAPPVETGNGSAAEFYSAASAYTSVPPGSGIANNPTNTASPAAPTPSRPPKVTKPGKLSSSSAALASGAAGAALGYATSNLHQQSQSSHQQTSSMSSYPPSINTPLNGQAFTPNQHYHSTSEPFIPTNSSFHDPPAINRPPKPGRDKRDPRVVPHLNTSRTSARQSGGMFGGFFSSQPEKKRKEHHKKKKGFFSFSNSSSSSSNSDLAFGNGFTTQRQKNRKDNKTKSDEHLNATLLGIGTTAAALAVARGGKKQSQRMPEVVAVRQRKGRKSHHDQRFGRENSREDEDGWESTSDFDEDASVSSGLAFGDFGSSGRGPARHSSMDSLTSQSSGTDKWGWRWGSKPDKKSKPPPQAYSGPAQYNTTSPGMPVGLNDTFYGPPPDPRLRRHPESATSSPISTNPMQPMRYVDPVPTSDFDASRHSSIPGAFPSQSPITARPAPVPIQQPQPITPVQPSLYTSQGIVQPPSSTSGGSAKYSQLPPSAGLRRTQSSPITSHFSRDAALAGVAAAATASILSNGRKSTKEDSPSNVRFELTDKQVRKEERERRREQDKGGARREEREQILTNEALEREQNQRRAAERQVAEDAVRREANAIRELAERAEAERRKEMERQRFEQEALARRKADIDAEAERLRDAERRKYEIATMMAGPAQREADESQNFGRSDQPVGSKYPREVSDKPDNWSQQRRHDVDNEQHRIYLEEHEDHPDSSKRAPPIMAGIAGATVGAVLAGAKHKGQSDQHERVVYEARPSDDRNGELEDDIYDPDFFRRKRSESDLTKHADIARKAAAKVVSDLEDRYRDPPPSQANFFAPKELSEPAKGKTKATDPIGDNDVQVYHVPGISLNEPPPPYQPSPDFLAKDKDKKSGRMPWNVPKLNVIAPTPPTSHAGSIKGDRSPISPVEDPQNYDEHGQRDSSLERRKANRVSWGEDQTRVFEVHTPESARDQFMSSQDLEDTQNQKRDEIVVETDEHDEQPQKTTYKAKELPKTTNEPAQSVHNETPSGNDRFYQRPFFESVSDLGLAMDSPGTEGAPPVRGFVEGEVDEPTPAEERLPHIPGGFDDEISTPPVESPFEASSSKKEKKKKGKAGKRASLEDSFFPPTVDMEQIQAEPEPEFEVPLSKKEKKKREKAAKRGLTDDPLPSPPVEIEARQEEVFDDGFEVPLSKKEQKKRAQDVGSGLADLESSSSFPAINDESRPDSQSADLPPDGQDYFLSKKEKKKRDKAARRGLDEYDSAPSSAVEPETASPVAEVAVELEPAEDDYFLSKKDKKKREKAAKRALLEEEVVPDIPPAELEEPAEQVDDFEIPLSKKEKKRRDKLAKQTSLDDNSLPSTPVEELSAIQLADDDFDYPLTAKEKKKRAKEAKRLGLDSTATAVLAGGAIGAALADLDTTHSYNNLERDPRDVEPELKAGPPRDVGGSEGRRASVPEFGLDEPDILADAKKLKKKSKRNSGAFNSPTVGSPLRSEIAWDDYVGSQVRGTSNEDQHHHHQGLDQAKDSEKEQFKDRYFEDRPMQQEPVNESNDRRTTDLASPESDRDARSVVSAPTGYDENSARHKSRRSRHENDDYETSGRSRSVAASEPADVYESSKKHKRRSKRDGEDFDDTASVTSARSSRSKYDEEDSSKSKKDKKGGILGLFRRKSSDSTSKSQGPDELDNELDEDKKHKKRHHRRKSSERDPYDDAASTTSSSRRQDEDVDDDARSEEYQSAAEDWASEQGDRNLSIFTALDTPHEEAEDVLGSQQTTPKASNFPQHVLNGRAHAEAEYYSWEDIEREEELHEKEIPEHPRFEAFGAQPRSENPKIIEEETQLANLSQETSGIRSLLQHDNDENDKRSSFDTAATAALTSAAIGLLTHEATNINDDPMSSDVWGDESDRGDDGPSYFDAAESDLLEKPIEPVRPTLSRASSSKKGKKGKKGKEIKLGTASISGPSTPIEVSPEELRNRRRRDTQDAVESWFEPATVDKYEKKKQGKKGKSQQEDLPNDRPDHAASASAATDETSASTVDKAAPDVLPDRNSSIEAAQVTLPETPPGTTQGETNRQLGEPHAIEVALPESPAFSSESLTASLKQPESTKPDNFQSTNAPETAVQPAKVQSDDYFPIVSRKKSKTGKKKQKYDSWDESTPEINEVGPEIRSNAALDISTEHMTSSDDVPTYMISPGPLADVKTDFSEQFPKEPPESAEAAIGSSNVSDREVYKTITDAVEEEKQPGYSFQTVSLAKSERKKKGKKGKKVDPWADDPPESPALSNAEPSTPVLEVTQQTLEAQPEFFQPAKKGKKGKKKQKDDPWTDEPVMTVSSAEQPLADSADSGLSLEAEPRNDRLAEGNDDLRPELIELPQGSDENLAEPVTATAPAENITTSEKIRENTKSLLQTSQSETAPEDLPLPETTDQDIDDPAVTTETSPDQLQSGTSQRLESESIATENIDEPHSAEVTTPAQEQGSSWLSWLPGSKKKKGKKAKGTPTTQSSSIDLSTALPKSVGASQEDSHLPIVGDMNRATQGLVLDNQISYVQDLTKTMNDDAKAAGSPTDTTHDEGLPNDALLETADRGRSEGINQLLVSEAISPRVEENQSTSAGLPLGSGDPDDDKLPAANADPEQTAEDEWAYTPIKKGKKAKKGKTNQALINPEPLNGPNELEKHVRPMSQDVSSVEGKVSLDPANIALPSDELLTETTPEDIPVPSEEQVAIPDQDDVTATETARPQEIRQLSQVTEPELESQEDFWAPTKKTKKGKKAKRGLDSPAEPTSQEISQPEGISAQQIPHSEQSEAVETEDLWSMSTKKGKKGKKGKKIADLDDALGQERKEIVKPTPEEIQLSSQQEDLEEKNPAIQESVNTLTQPETPQADDEWALPLSKKSKKARKGKISALGNTQVVEDPVSPFVTSTTVTEPVNPTQEVVEEKGANREPDVTAATLDDMAEGGNDLRANLTEEVRDGTETKKLVLEELDRDVSQDKELEPQTEKAPPQELVPDEAMKVLSQEQDIWATPKAKKGKKGRRGPVDLQEESLQPIMPEATTKTSDEAKLDDQNVSTQDQNNQTTVPTNCEDKSPTDLLPDNGTYTSDNVINQTDDSMEPEDVFATPIADRQITFETPMTETPDIFMTPFEPHTPVPATHPGNVNLRIRSTPPSATRRTSYFGQGASYIDPIISETTAEDSAAALLASTVPLPGDDFTPNPSINEHVQDSKKPSSSPNPIKNDDLLEDAAQVPIEESATKEGETVHESNAVSLDALRDDNQTDEALRQHDPDKAQSKPDHDLPPKPELDPADAAQDEAWPLFPVKQSKKDKKKAKKAKTQEQEPIDTVADGSQAPLEDPADHLQPKNDDIEPYEPTEKPTEKSTVDEPILPAKLSKKGKKKAEKSTSTWSDSWMPEGPQEPTPEALPLETVDSRQAEESIASADSTAGQHDATVKPIQEDMFVLPSKRSKKDKKKANKADLWEEDTWSAEQPDTSPMHPVDVPISDTEILPEPDTKEQADFELTETTETHNSEEEAKSTLPSKPSKKDKKKAKKAMTWNEPSLSEPEEILPGKESNEKATSEVLDELVEGQTMSGDARGETSEMPTEDTGFPQPVKLSKKDKKKAKKAKAWEEWPAEISQDKSIEEASQESSAASMIPEDETLQTVLDTAKKTPLPEIEEAEVLAKLSKKDKKKAKKLKADEETLGEAIEEIPQQATATSAASTIEALKTIQDVAEETPLPGEEEDELPATLSKKDKKKARKARAWEDWPTEETQGQPTVETPQDDTAIGQEIGETLTTTKPLSDDHGETTREIAEETALPEEKPDALAKPSKKDKKKGKKVKAWEEWPTDETREGATEELPQDIPASQEGPREALTLGTLSLKNGVETVQELAEDIPLADEQPEALPKLSKKDKKKAKKSKAWEDPWPSEETQENKEIDQEIGQAISDPNAQPTSLNDDFGTVQKEETTLPDPNLATSAKQTKKEKRKAKKGKSLAWDDVEESVDESGTTTPVTTQQQVGPIATQDTRTDGAHDSDNNQFHPVTNTIEAPDLAVSKMPEPDPEGSLMPASASKKSKKDKKKAKKNTYTWDEAESVPQSPAVEDPVRQTNTAEDASAGNIHETMSIHDQSGDFKVPDPSVQPDERGASPKKLQDSSEEIDRPAELQGEQRTACDREIDTLPINEQAQQQTPGIEESESPRQDIDFAATLAAGLENSGFDPNLVVNDPIFHRRASPPGQAEADPEEFFITKKNRKGKKDKLTKAVESQESQESTPIEDTAKSLAGRSEPEISNEKDTKDGGFSAALTAGLAAAGFASNILQGSSSDHDAITEEPEEFSFAIPKRKKGKKGNKSLPLTPDMGEQTKDSIPENPDISVGAAVDEAPVGSSKFEAPAIPDPEPLGLIPEQSAQLEESTLLPHPAEIGVAAVVPHTTLDSEEPADAPAESSREISEPAAEEEFALASKKKGKKGKKKGVAWQLTEDEPAEEAAGATTADTGLTNESAGLFQTPWLKDMMPGSSLPTPDQQEIAPIAIQEAPKDTSPEDKFMEEAFTGFSSKKRKGKKDKKSKIAPENTDIEEKLNEEAKQEIGEETKAGEQVQSIHVNDVLDPQPATETRALKDTTLQDVPQPEFGTSQQTAEEKSPIALSSEDAISPTSKIANIFPGLQRVKRRTTSTASHEQNKPRQESLGELTESEPGSTSSRLPPIETKDTGASSNRASSTISDYRQSGTFTPIDMDTPVENDQAKTAASNDHSVEEGERRAKTILSDEPSWSFDNLRDSGVPSLDSPVSPETPYKRDTVRDSGYNDDSEAQISSDNKNKQPRSERTRSPEDPIRVSIELNPDWSLPVAKQRSARKKGKLDDRTISESIKEEGTHSTSSPPSPVESTTKDRTSYLFSSPPDVERGGAAGSRHAAASPVNRSIPEVAGRDDRMDYFAPTPEEAIRQPTSPATVLLGGTTPAYSEHTTPAYSEHAPPARKKSRDISDVGSPEQGVKSARRTATPLQSFRERMNTLASQEAHPEVKSNLRNDVGSQWSLSGREEEQAGDNGGDLRIDTRRGLEDLRSGSASSNRPTSSGSHSMRPYDQIRSSSAASNRSTTPSLRRVDRSVSGDLRAASRASRRGDPRDAPGPKTITIEPPPTPPLQEEDENAFNGPGNARTPDMSNVYEGWGDVRGSSMSPTRPPSVRKRQSMHISDLQTQLDALVAENRQLQEANNNVEQSHRNISQQFDAEGQAFQVELEERDEQLREKDAEVQQLREMLEPLQQEIARLTEINADLTETKRNLLADTNNRYASIQREHSQTRQQWKESHRELESLRQQHNELTVGMEDIVRKEIAIAMQDRNAEIRRLREELETATQQIRALQSQILSSKTEDFLSAHDEDYFDTACQKLCQHVQQWVLRFSKYSDNRMCRLTSDLADEKIEARLDNTILDGSDVDKLLGDRIRRRDVFMSLVMSMIWEYVFTRYLFGMDREQRQKLKALEKILLEVGPTRAVAHWRATTLTLLSRRPAFATQRNLDTEAVAQEIFSVLSTLLPPPSQMETQILTSLRNVLRLAVDLSIEMRTQRAEYIMLPPLQPEYDTHGDLVRKVHFNAALMNERSGEHSSNDELERNMSVVKMVLFPLVVKKGNDEGEGEDEIVVCPAQVLVAGSKLGKKVVRVLSGAMEIDEPRRSKQSLLSGMDGGSANMI
ncbi:hypothetical protein MBLNU459_g1801t1 [Dothideomycetes sp. NU459]